MGTGPHRAKDKSASGEKARNNCKAIRASTLNLANSLQVQQTTVNKRLYLAGIGHREIVE